MAKYLKKALETSDEDVAAVQNAVKEIERSGTICVLRSVYEGRKKMNVKENEWVLPPPSQIGVKPMWKGKGMSDVLAWNQIESVESYLN